MFPLFGAFYYWFPKITGRMLSERARPLGLRAVLHRLQPDVLSDARARAARHAAPGLHLPGGDGWGTLNLIAGDGALLDGVGVVLYSRRRRSARCDAAQLAGRRSRGTPARSSGRPVRRRRHATSSPPPTVGGRDPLWETRRTSRSSSACAPTCAKCWSRTCWTPSRITASNFRIRRSGRCSTALATTALFIWSIFTPWGVVYGRGAGVRHDGRLVLAEAPDEGGTRAWPIRHRDAADARRSAGRRRGA